jgi:hypothetical protein
MPLLHLLFRTATDADQVSALLLEVDAVTQFLLMVAELRLAAVDRFLFDPVVREQARADAIQLPHAKRLWHLAAARWLAVVDRQIAARLSQVPAPAATWSAMDLLVAKL